MGQNVNIRCALTHVGRSTAEGIQDVIRNDGVQLAHCRIRGAWMGPSGRLARIPDAARDNLSDGHLDGTKGLEEPGVPSSLFCPPEPLRPGTLDLTWPQTYPEQMYQYMVTVRTSDLDIFHHVNAANYVRYVADALSVRGLSPSLHRAELRYIGQAREGDTLSVCSWDLGNNLHAANIMRNEEMLFQSVVQTEATPS